MKPKQREMDAVYERLFTRLGERDKVEGRKSLIVLVGDHGMSELGNHGGSSEGEVSAALVFASPSAQPEAVSSKSSHKSPYRFHEVVQQIDLVPTLSVLLGLGIPTCVFPAAAGQAVAARADAICSCAQKFDGQVDRVSRQPVVS